MKRLHSLMIIFLVLLLSACSNNGTEATQETDTDTVTVSESVENPEKETTQEIIQKEQNEDAEWQVTEKESENPKETKSENAEDEWNPLEFSEIDWTAYKEKLGAEKYELLQSYMPVLTENAEFTWLDFRWVGKGKEEYRRADVKKKVTLRQMIAELQGSKLAEAKPRLYSLGFCDVFQTGSQDLILNLTNAGYMWVIFHYEGDTLYGIYQGERCFEWLQTNGIYSGSSGAGSGSYHRMEFLEGEVFEYYLADYLIEKSKSVYHIGNIKVSQKKFVRWVEKHCTEEVVFYTPTGAVQEEQENTEPVKEEQGCVEPEKETKEVRNVEAGNKKKDPTKIMTKGAKHDRAVLTQLIKQINGKKENDVSENLNNAKQYRWNDKGRLVGINWDDCWIVGGVKSLKFEKLPKLKTLELAMSPIEKLDVSNLKNLTFLDCSYCDELKSLALGKLENLEYLRCDTCPKLESLDVRGQHKLKKLRCSNCGLKNLHLPDNGELRQLSCSWNRLSTLSLADVPKLEKLVIRNNYLTELDLESVPELTYLDWSYNKNLTSLDATALHKLKELRCNGNYLTDLNVSGLEQLETLDCDENRLTRLDVSGNKKLVHLHCGNNNLEVLDVSSLQNLKGLYCSYNHLTELDVTALPKLSDLSCERNAFISLDLSQNPQLEFVYCDRLVDVPGWIQKCDYNYGKDLTTWYWIPKKKAVQTEEVQAVSTAAKQGTKEKKDLTKIMTSGAKRDRAILKSMIKQIKKQSKKSGVSENFNNKQQYKWNEKGRLVRIDWSVLLGDDVKSLKFGSLTKLTKLDVDYNKLTELDVSRLKSLKRLSCKSGKMEELHLEKLSKLEVLDCSYSSKLKELDVSSNRNLKTLWCMDCGLKDLDLQNNAKLEKLHCQANKLTSLYLTGTPKLRRLEITGNCFRELDIEGVPELVHLECSANSLISLDVTGLSKLEYLDCEDNYLTNLDISGLPQLKSLYCGRNRFTNLDVSQNPELKSLWCEYNALQELDISSLGKLQVLACYGNWLTGLDVTAQPKLGYLYCERNNLTSLDVSQNPKLDILQCDRWVDVPGWECEDLYSFGYGEFLWWNPSWGGDQYWAWSPKKA